MNRYSFKHFTIEIFDHSENREDQSNYHKIYFVNDENNYQSSSKYGIRVYDSEQKISTCILIGSEGTTTIHPTSSLLDNDRLIICCSNTIFSLVLPELELNWKIEADPITCFQIIQYEEDYIVHGELQISKITPDGTIKWTFGGSDIFVCIDGESSFELMGDHILLRDFEKNIYKLDFNGQLME